MPEGFIPVIKQHGNAKTSTPFHPTWASTKKRIKEQCAEEGPKSIVNSISKEVGGIINAVAPGQLPRNEKQVVNFKKKLSHSTTTHTDAASDDLFIVMQKAYSDDPLHKFIRAVNAAPEPAIVVSTNSQLKDLARFCTSSFEFSILCIDPTFNLGDFDVTLTTFKHLFLQSKRYKQSPIFLGPACIHFKKSFATYLFFASTMIGQYQQLTNIRAIGTDGEVALIDAFKHEFSVAHHLTCFIHVQRNVKEKLHEFQIPSDVGTEIVNDTFGIKVGSTYIEGLVDSINIIEFDRNVSKLTDKWRNLEIPSAANIEGFIDWFTKYKAPVIRKSMIRDLREECGLGCPPAPFTTNSSETANAMLKNKVRYKKKPVTRVSREIKRTVFRTRT
jgi:hypothetical protein